MPEGPEIWILSEAINKLYHAEKTKAYGKHLFVFNKDCSTGENWSFGLTGKVCLLDNNELIKLHTGWICGDQLSFDDYDSETQKLGINWLTSSEADLRKEIDSWINSKKKLAGLMLDQTKISGIGVAWGSEILFKAGLRPDMRACDQVLTEGSDKLADSMIEIRENIKKLYSEQVDENNCRGFINNWFENLYEIRDMNIYKKGSKIEVLGRSWWV